MIGADRLREEIAQRIASHIADSGMDWSAARSRALDEFGGRRRLPSNAIPSGAEIETAVRAHWALFAPEEHARVLDHKRTLALRVLALFEGFDAYLTGAVLNGAAGVDSSVCIEVFTDDVKAVLSILMDADFDVEALDTACAPFGRAEESAGFVVPWCGALESVRVDVVPPRLLGRNPARAEPDAYQQPWEALGRIGLEKLRKNLEKPLAS